MSNPVIDLTELDDYIAAIIQPGGIAHEDGLVFSGDQRDYASRFTLSLIRAASRDAIGDLRPSVTMIGADTGTGKTVAFGVPLLVYAALGAKVGISTHTHALQRQFIGTPENPGDLERIGNWLEMAGLKRLKIARRVGKQAFISHRAASKLVAEIESRGNPLRISVDTLDDIVDFAAKANLGRNSGLIDELKDMLGGELPKGVSVAAICLMGDSKSEDAFAYEAHLQKAEDADVVLFSHAYLLSCTMFRKSKFLKTPLDALVLDEADILEAQASDCFRFDASVGRISRVVEKIGGDEAAEVSESLAAISDLCSGAFTGENTQALSDMGSAFSGRITTLCIKASNALYRLVNKKMKDKSKSALLQDTLAELTDAAGVLERFANVSDKSHAMLEGVQGSSSTFACAVNFSPTKHSPSLCIMPINPGQLVSRVWDFVKAKSAADEDRRPVKSVLLTSATFTTSLNSRKPDARPFQHTAQSINIRFNENPHHIAEVDLWASYEPAKFGAVRYVLADPSLPSPVDSVDDGATVLDERWLNYAVLAISKAKAAGGRTLVLLTSYADVQVFCDRLLSLGIECLAQRRGQGIADMRDAFMADKHSVWLSPTAWAGLNLPGAISNLVVPRLPFRMADPVSRALMRSTGKLISRSVDNILAARALIEMKSQLRQGLGRPIRSSTDKARIWICDPRFPMHRKSAVPARYPDKIYLSQVKRYDSAHDCVPRRFEKALVLADILLGTGEILKAK